MASSPSLLRARRFEAPSAHPRDLGSDGFLALTARRHQMKGEADGGAHATTQAVAPVLSLAGVRRQGFVKLDALFLLP